mmetsp:Transcript_549/g.1580  ORF Transcript_549/g.1580 Transcript_549/m.1580 type:complete len:121 (-) Transcript_549:35-397(-)
MSSPASLRGLLRTILRTHKRMLPAEMRSLGDKYVRKEFQDMKAVTDAQQLLKFQNAWHSYLRDLHTPNLDQKIGRDLDVEVLQSMSDDQKTKLVDMRSSSLPRDEDGKLLPNFTPSGGKS